MAEKISAAFEAEVKKYVSAVESRPDAKPNINNYATKAWVAAMQAYAGAVLERIEAQQTAGGGSPGKLSDEYETFKTNKVGFAYPVGKLSGQLLDALNPDGVSIRNIRLSRS